MMAALRNTVDPKVLDRVRLAAEGKEPYDKENARAAVTAFLAAKSRNDGGAFQRKLMEALRKDAATASEAPPPPKPAPPKAPPPTTRPLGKAPPPRRRFGLF